MSLTYNQITAIVNKYIIPKAINNAFDHNAVMKRFYRPGYLKLIDGGDKITQPVISDKPSQGGFYSDLDALSTTRTDNATAVAVDWRQLQEPIRISQLELLKARGKFAQLNLLQLKGEIADFAIRDNFSLGIFSDGGATTGANDTNQFDGLQGIMSTSSTYGGIAVADMATWVSQVVTGASAGTDEALSLARMQRIDGLCGKHGPKPTAIFCKQDVYDEYWNLVQPTQRIISSEMKGLGFDNIIEFNGRPVIQDEHMKAGSMFFVNEDHVFFCVHPAENFRKETFEKLETSNSMLVRIFVAGNILCNMRMAQGELDDISVAS